MYTQTNISRNELSNADARRYYISRYRDRCCPGVLWVYWMCFFFFLLSAERQRTELYAAYNTAKCSPPALAQTHTMSSVDDSISKYEQFFFCLHQSKIHAQRSVIKKMIFFSLQNQKTQTNQWKKLNSNKRNIMFEVDIEPCVISALAWAKKNIFV